MSRLELPRRNAMGEEQINLTKRPIFRLRKPKPAPDVAKQVGHCVEEGGLGSPIPGCS